MFKISYRIITESDYWKKLEPEQIEREGGISGFFQMRFCTEEYGYYHERDLASGEEGFDIISTWLDNLLWVCKSIHIADYTALKDIESYNTWIEFVRKGDYLAVSMMESDELITEYLVTCPPSNRTYPQWKDVLVSRDEFQNEVLEVTESFIREAATLNAFLPHCTRFKKMAQLLNEIKGHIGR
ncbi:hypothetical protein B5M42_008210 [Paenibacillus athensensis]|uniref:Uncharacterized protein n=1 Tax=Paenibacillus athensensis TaxID=1967502 RepID=A0A4Y8PYH8_9BACL|nr:hypothetical protein [Paenibacillus athensensis]MCD1258817.1 hypothetical protein [Paenibacillus athensensis]